ncbi:HNHc domain-containing protein [Trichophyton interdigitale]|uniref:HNHc domain-containing protein n=1 Tax=Trichophyton interdigitale TaxID=101480 RepID=A0A9P5CX94_9EURO|nr:HNHc domain-containing protein [Trichophyton interdigitale]KAF3894817.1 HNHc domain-containing protein [Trichophyton interdigitale]KAG8208509.1 HNHc domain-containing protein [Trichophyton interdigitale]
MATTNLDRELREPLRRELIGRIVSALGENNILCSHLPALFWALLWFSDIEILEVIVHKFSNDVLGAAAQYTSPFRDSDVITCFTSINSGSSTVSSRLTTGTASPAWNPAHKKRKLDSEETESKSPKTSRSKRASQDCRKRDKMCIITKATEPCEVAHIIPYSFCSKSKFSRASFWNALKCFWKEDEINQFRQLVDQISEKSIENTVLLAPHAHSYWDRQLFVLEPVQLSDDHKMLQLKFHWLQPSMTPFMTQPSTESESNLSEPPTMPGNLFSGGRPSADSETPNVRLYDCQTDARIPSGHVITLHTEDPVNCPLPNIELFRLQWLMHRVSSLAAAGADYFLDDDSDTPDEYDENGERIPLEVEFDSADESISPEEFADALRAKLEVARHDPPRGLTTV